MNIPVINPTSVTVGVVFPPTPIQKDQLTQIYSKIVHDNSEYSSFNLFPQGGARIARADGSYVHIDNNKVQVFDNISDISFTHSKERIMGIFNTVFPPITPPIIIVTGIKLIAQVAADQLGGATKVIDSVLSDSMKSDKIEYHLGPKLTGIGLRLSMQKDQPWPSVYELRIEPFFRDMAKLYIELDVQFPQPTPNNTLLESRIEHVAAYMKGSVKDFLSAL